MAGVWTKLGTMLVGDHVIRQQELEQALGAQAIYGGRLGTNLVDLQLLSIETVANYLAAQLEVPTVGVADLLEVPPTVVGILTREQCARHRVMPISADGDLLRLAMIEPRDSVACNEIGLLTKMRVVPHVAPELLLLQALEKRYGIKREKRFLRAPQRAVAPQEPSQDLPEPPRRPGAISLLMPAVSQDDFDAHRRPAARSNSRPPEVEPIPGAGEELDLLYDVEEETADYFDADDYIDSDTTNQWDRPTVEVLDIEAAISSLRRVQDREAVVNHLIRCFHQGVTCVLFVVRGPLAVAHVAAQTKVKREVLENLILPVTTPSLLEQALTTGTAVYAAATSDPMQQVIARHLGWPDPGEACVAPVRHGAEVINLLCVQTPSGVCFPEDFPGELGRLCDEAGESYDRLVKTHQQSSNEELIPIEAEPVEPSEAEPERPKLYDTRFFITGLAEQHPTVTVWRAVDTSTQKVAGVHVLKANALEMEEIQRLTQNALKLQKISHPGLPKHLGTGITEQGWAYVVTEWIEGIDLRTRLKADPVPPRVDVASIIGGICGVLEVTHRQGVFHRNLHPENVLLESPKHRQAKLINFGFVRDPSMREGTPALDDLLYGDPAYRAPEINAGKSGGAAADAYAVGVLAFQMLAGRLPRGAIEPIDLATVPSSARKLITLALSAKPDRRPTVDALGKRLALALRGPVPPRR